MNPDYEKIDKVLVQLNGLLSGKVEQLFQKLRQELMMRINDEQLLSKILNAIEIILNVEKQELSQEQKLNALNLIREQQQQIKLFTLMERYVNIIEENPDKIKDVLALLKQLEKSLQSEIVEIDLLEKRAAA